MQNLLLNSEKWSNLIESMYSNQLIIFAGAGCSADAGIPTGKILSKTLCDEFLKKYGKAPGHICSKKKRNNLERVTEYIAKKCGKQTIFEMVDFEEWNNKILDEESFHIRIANLVLENYLGDIITTNYDCLFEQALKSRGIEFKTIVAREDSENIPESWPKIYKIYGCLSLDKTKWDETIIITKSDLKTWGKRENDEWILDTLKTNLLQKKFLVLGFGKFQTVLKDTVIKVVKDLKQQSEQFFWIGRSVIPKPNLKSFFKKFRELNVKNNYYCFDSLPEFVITVHDQLFKVFIKSNKQVILEKITDLCEGLIEEESIIQESWTYVKSCLFEAGNDVLNFYYKMFVSDHRKYLPLRSDQSLFIEFLVNTTFIYILLVESLQVSISVFRNFNHLEIEINSASVAIPQIRNIFLYNAYQLKKYKVPIAFNTLFSKLKPIEMKELAPFIAKKFEDPNKSLVIVIGTATTIPLQEKIITIRNEPKEEYIFLFISFSKIIDTLHELRESKTDYFKSILAIS